MFGKQKKIILNFQCRLLFLSLGVEAETIKGTLYCVKNFPNRPDHPAGIKYSKKHFISGYLPAWYEKIYQYENVRY